ncbi:MAG: TonB-dependent receptor [Cytophagales bacterium]|nr:TonB-dependent receptor [Cytophagales bacterium]
MKKKWLLHLYLMTKYSLIGFTVQLVLLTTTFATNVDAQQISSVKEVTINVDFNNTSLKDVFNYVEAKTDFRFTVFEDENYLKERLSYKKSSVTVEQLLLKISKDNDLRFQQINNSIGVRRINDSKGQEKPIEILIEGIKITGKVTSEEDQSGLPGVNVMVKGTSQGTVTDVEGNYSLVIPDENAILAFSAVGYITEEVVVSNLTVIDMVLTPDITKLDEIVVVGYGTMKKSDVTGSVASVKSEDFIKAVATDAMHLIQGKASGVYISQANAEPGAATSIRIRGAGSINSSNSALVVIDGLPGGSTSDINPSDIESVEVLKDASAAAIYGTRAANGVVLITTKKGVKGEPEISYDTYWAYQTPLNKFDVLNATQYMQRINDLSQDLGNAPPYTDEEIAQAGEGTDWQDELMRNAWATNHHLSIRSGNEKSSYYGSIGYLGQDGIMVSSGIKKYFVHLNMNTQLTDRFKFGLNIAGIYNDKDIIPNTSNGGNENGDPLNMAIWYDPLTSAEKGEDGNYERNPLLTLDNPVAVAYGRQNTLINNRMYGNTFGELKIIDGLKATAKLGADINNTRSDSYFDKTTIVGLSNGGRANVSSTNYMYWLAEGLLDYEKKINKHSFHILAGATWERFQILSHGSGAVGFLSDVTGTNLLQSGNPERNTVSSSKIVRQLQSFIGRINYSYFDKYLLTASIRRDGTSRFSETNKYAYFPSMALGWRVSEEAFMNGLPFISDLKLRLGYGQIGNEGIGNFETIPTYVAGGNAVLGGVVQSGAEPARIPNQDLTWETTEEYNLGLDFGFFDNRISGSIEYFRKNTIDQLFSKPVPQSTGFSTVRTNLGTVRNSGIDFDITTRNLVGEFKWNTTIVLSTLKNEVVELPPFTGDIIVGDIAANIPDFSIVREGEAMYSFYGYKVTGIFQEGEDIANSAQPNAKPGEPIFFDRDGNNKIDSEDRVILGSPLPDMSYSMNNTFLYKNFALDIYILGVQGMETFNANAVESLVPTNFERNSFSKHYFDRWTPTNPDAEFPSGVNSSIYFGSGRKISSYTIQDASYLRLKNVTLSYNLSFQNFNLFKSILFSVSGENLFTMTNLEGIDPEANQSRGILRSSWSNYPLAKIYRVGAKITF